MYKSRNPTCLDVLLVEDNEGDVILVRKALEAAATTAILHVVSNGADALDFVRQENPRPDLIILDLNLPQMSGNQVLLKLKSDATICKIPVVIFTSSAARGDIHGAYAGHASGYVQKPVNIDDFFAAVASIERYWARTVLLPPT
jgi:CheY-like chemotaxis protein